ncbi:hypothetical protein ABK040_001061 [Willaertia magna]
MAEQTTTSNVTVISKVEFEQHGETHKDPWIMVNGGIYAIKDYQFEHPGGSDILLDFAGRDATKSFESIGHSESAIQEMRKLLVGVLEGHEDKLNNKSVEGGNCIIC